MRRYLNILLAVFMVFLLNTVALASKPSSNDNAKVRVGYFNFAGFQDVSDTDTLSGYSYDYLNEISKYTGWKYEYVFCSWSECLQKLQNHEIDFVGSAEKTPERELIYDFPINDSGILNALLYVRGNDNRFVFEDYKAINGMHVGLVIGNIGNKKFLGFVKENNLEVKTTEYDEKYLAQALSDGEVDAILVNSLYRLEKHRPIASLYNVPSYYMTYKGNTKMLAEFDKAVSAIKSTNPYFDLELYRKHYPQSKEDVLMLTRSEAEYVSRIKKITVVYNKNLRPVQYYDEKTKEFSGVVATIFREIARKTGLTFEFIPVASYEEAYEYIMDGRADMISMDIDRTNYISKFRVIATSPYMQLPLAQVRNKDARNKSGKGHKVAICQSTIYEKMIGLDEAEGSEFIFFETPEDCINAVNKGKVHETFVYNYIAEYYLQNGFYKNIAFLKMTDIKFPISIGISEFTDVKLLTIMNRAIKNISDTKYSELILNSIYSGKPEVTLLRVLYSNPIEAFMITSFFFFLILLMFFLRISMLQAKLANASKSMFLAKMSHEIRTPINAITGFLRLLRDEKQTNTSLEYIDIIEKSTKTLLELVNSILDISKVESGKTKLDKKEFNIGDELDSISRLFVAAMSEKNLLLKTYIDSDLPISVIGDQLKLRQVLSNLLNNALKFTQDGGSITLQVTVIEKRNGLSKMKFSVKDSGIGISKADVNTIFNPFHQLEDSTVSKQRGTGLGLTIARDFVKLMGGNIAIESEVGVGSEFYFTLDMPIVIDSEKLTLANGNIAYIELPARNEGIDKSLGLLGYSATEITSIAELKTTDMGKFSILIVSVYHINDDIMKSLAELRSIVPSIKILLICYAQESLDFSMLERLKIMVIFRPISLGEFNKALIKMITEVNDAIYSVEKLTFSARVLVVEDDFINSKLITLVLAKYGLDVVAVSNGKLAFEKYRDNFDLILMDINMPVMDGLVATEKIRDDELKNCYQHIPIVALTANIMKGDDIKYKQTGINDVLSKPLDIKALEDVLTKYLTKH